MRKYQTVGLHVIDAEVASHVSTVNINISLPIKPPEPVRHATTFSAMATSTKRSYAAYSGGPQPVSVENVPKPQNFGITSPPLASHIWTTSGDALTFVVEIIDDLPHNFSLKLSRPIRQTEFDAQIAIFTQKLNGWSPKDYCQEAKDQINDRFKKIERELQHRIAAARLQKVEQVEQLRYLMNESVILDALTNPAVREISDMRVLLRSIYVSMRVGRFSKRSSMSRKNLQ